MRNRILGLVVISVLGITSIIGQSKAYIPMPEFYHEIIDNAAASDVFLINSKKLKTTRTNRADQYLAYSEQLQIDDQLWSRRGDGVPNLVQVNLEFKGKSFSLILQRKYLKSPTYHLSTSSKKSVSKSIDAYYYSGVIEGQYESWATLALINGKYKILLASEDGNIEISHQKADSYTVYESEDLVSIPEYTCHTEETSSAKPIISQDSRSVGSDCIELYIECDHQSYIDNGNSIASTEAWALAIINDVSTIYNTINVPLVVNNVFVWDSADPYASSTSVQAVRDSFVDQLQNTYDGRVAQLFSTRPLGGGLAYGVGGLCGSFPDFPGPYSIATSLAATYDPYPNFSFTVNVVAHELGHVLGARHTHACVWGTGFDSQIDDCGNVYATQNGNQPEGQECYDESNPILPIGGGTIMSFCNLSGGGIDLANGFGTEVGDFIYDQYSTAPCATGDDCASIPPANDDCINALELSANGVCTFISYDNILATASGVPDPLCGNAGVGLDVWFQFTATFTEMNLEFNPVANQVEDVIITLYSGTCGALTELSCDEGTNEQLSIKLNELTVNDTYYIRVIETGSDEFGNFELCLLDEFLPCHPAINQLVELYNNTNGASWATNTGWVAGAASSDCLPCDWYGITCDNQNNIIGIDLFNNNLVGTVPSSLGEISTLRTLKLMNNNLSGAFPDIWSDLLTLEFIDLSNNNFTGNMPASLGSLIKLNTLYIENNNMDGELLPEIADLPLINVYWTKDNNFNGCYPASYSALCDVGSVKFTNNPLLPSSGNAFDDFCLQGIGGDLDEDDFCFGNGVGEDCVDTDNTIYPNAPELCDGKDNDCDGDYDENLVDPNTWILSTGGDWNTAANWSLGVVPAGCHDVIFPASGTSRTITIGIGIDALARSVTIFDNNIMVNNGALYIAGSDDQGLILNAGAEFNNGGMTDIRNVSIHGIQSDGSIENAGDIIVENLGSEFEIYILSNAQFINNGTLRIK